MLLGQLLLLRGSAARADGSGVTRLEAVNRRHGRQERGRGSDREQGGCRA
jgi:hypothetical protein